MNDLTWFVALADTQHMTLAAALLHITQPTLPRSLARFEQERGTPLFDRANQRLRLNTTSIPGKPEHLLHPLSDDAAHRVLADPRWLRRCSPPVDHDRSTEAAASTLYSTASEVRPATRAFSCSPRSDGLSCSGTHPQLMTAQRACSAIRKL